MPRDDYDAYLRRLERLRAPAVAAAEPLLGAGRFDEADRLVLAADESIYGRVALARLYADELRRLAADGSTAPASPRRPHAEALFRRALAHKHACYPDPHTAVEAEDFARGRADDRAELVAIFGCDPTAADRAPAADRPAR